MVCAGQAPRTEVAEVFGGMTRSRVTCLMCKAVSDKLDPFYDLSLDLHGCFSVYEALKHFTAPDRLEGSNLYCCETCKRYADDPFIRSSMCACAQDCSDYNGHFSSGPGMRLPPASICVLHITSCMVSLQSSPWSRNGMVVRLDCSA